MENKRRCPVCGKPLTQGEYDKALGLWKHKQDVIEHLEAERKKLRIREASLRRLAEQKDKEFRAREAELMKQTRQLVAKEAKRAAQNLRNQRDQLERKFQKRMRFQVKLGIAEGVEQQRRQFKRQEAEFRKSKNKMAQLERSLTVSARKYDQASDEIKRLKQQIEKGITPQMEGLLEEATLLAKLRELFKRDRFEHPGKGGDIIQIVVEQNHEIGKIVYECKKVKHFDRKHVEQTRDARRTRHADFAILVTNAFPSKQQFYFVEKTVFVISPLSLEPITYTLRESLVRMALLKMTNKAKEEAVQRVYDYLSSSEYHSKMNDIAGQLLELGKDLKSEISSHKRTWTKRYHAYRGLFSDAGSIDSSLRELANPKHEQKGKLLPAAKREFVEIRELDA